MTFPRTTAVTALLLAVVAVLVPATLAHARTPVELGAAVSHPFLGSDARYRDTFMANYGSATPEAAFKIDQLQPARGRFDFGMADAMLGWVEGGGKRMHGHTLIWCDDTWAPEWLKTGSWTRDQLIAVLRDHVRTVVGRYRGRIPAWDVVNEAFNANGTIRDCVWSRVIGPEYIELAFRAASEADPAAKLFYNEYNADLVNQKFQATEAMAKDLLARGVPIHGIGLQMHLFGPPPPQYRIEEALARIGALGLAAHISELDVKTSDFAAAATVDERLALQAQTYETVAMACRRQPACVRLTTWGFTDAFSFRGAAEMALPWDTEYRPKPAWAALTAALRPATTPPGNRPPSQPGRPTADTPVTASRQLTLRWSAASDADGHPVTYVLEHRDANDAAWSTVASGVRGTSYSFATDRWQQYPEPQGTWRYRVRATDGSAETLSAESEAVVVDRASPAPPRIDAGRPAEGAGDTFRDRVTLTFADGGDPALPDGSPGAGFDPASAPAAQTFSTTGTHTVTGAIRDRAGNLSGAASRSVQVDADAPRLTVAATLDGAEYDGRWTNRGVALDYTCTDAGAGVTAAPADTVVTQEGRRAQTAECRDGVGHVSTVSSPVLAIDRTPPAAPVASADRPPEDAAGAWYRDRVDVRYAAAGDPLLADGSAGSGVDPASVPAVRSFTQSGTAAGTVKDRAGNVSAETAFAVRVDATGPSVSLQCPATAEAGGEAFATWTASDAQSGLTDAAAGRVALDTTSAGRRTATIERRDRVGHATTATCAYEVTASSSSTAPAPEQPPPTAEEPAQEPVVTAPAAPPREPAGENPSASTAAEAVTTSGAASAGTPARPVPADQTPAVPGVSGVAAPAAARASLVLPRAGLRPARAGIVRLRVRCSGSTGRACVGDVELRKGRTRASVKTVRFTVAAGRTKVVSIRLTARMRVLLRRVPRAELRAIVRLGTTGVLNRPLLLRR